MRPLLSCLLSVFCVATLGAQTGRITGTVSAEGTPLDYATITLKMTNHGTYSEEDGSFALANIPPGTYTLHISFLGYQPYEEEIKMEEEEAITLTIALRKQAGLLDEVVVTGTLKEVSRLESPVPVEVLAQILATSLE